MIATIILILYKIDCSSLSPVNLLDDIWIVKFYGMFDVSFYWMYFYI